MSSSTGTRKPRDVQSRANDALTEGDKNFIAQLKIFTGESNSTAGLTGQSVNNSPKTPAGNYLAREGDSMIGPLALGPPLDFRIEVDANNTIDIGPLNENPQYSSNVQLDDLQPNSSVLDIIANAAFDGQLLILRTFAPTTPYTISQGTFGNGGNIQTPDSNDITLGDLQMIALVFDESLIINANTGGTWRVLSGVGAGGTGTGTFVSADLTADQLANLAVGQHVEFDRNTTPTGANGGIVLQTGAGQANGIFELKANLTYFMTAAINPKFSATNQVELVWYDITNAVELGRRTIYNDATLVQNQPKNEIIFSPLTDVLVEVRLVQTTTPANLTGYISDYTFASIFEFSGSGGGGGGGLSEPVILTINTITPETLPTTSIVDWSLNPNQITLDRNVEFSFANLPPNGKYEGVLVIIDVDATGGYDAPIWPASVQNPPNVPTTANSRTSVMLYTIDNGTVVTHATSVGSSTAGSVSNWSTFPAIQVVNMANFSFSNYVGYTAGVGQSMDVGALGNTWNLPSGDSYIFNVNGLPQFEILENQIDVHNHSITNYIGWTGLVGQSSVISASGINWTLPPTDTYKYQINGLDQLEISETQINLFNNSFTNFVGWTGLVGQGQTVDATGIIYDLPTGDQYNFRVNGTSELVVAGGGSAFNSPLSMNTNKITSVVDPTNLQDAATKNYVDLNSGDPSTWSTFPATQAVNMATFANTNYGGFTTSLVGQGLGISATGFTWDLPTGDSHLFRVNGVSIFEITSIGMATSKLLQFNDSAAFPTAIGQMSRNGNVFSIEIPELSTRRITTTGTDLSEFSITKVDASPANADSIGALNYKIDDSGVFTNYARIRGEIRDVTDAGRLLLQVRANNASLSTALEIIGDDNNLASFMNVNSRITSDVTFGVETGATDLKIRPVVNNMGYFVSSINPTVGTEGSLELPTTTSTPGTKAVADGLAGAFFGSALFEDNGSQSILYIRQSNGNWSAVILTRDTLV